MSEDRCQRAEGRCQRTDSREHGAEGIECGNIRHRAWRMGQRAKSMAHGAKGVGHGAEGIECGLRPLRAVGSIYEPEAVGDIGAYTPEGSGNAEGGNIRHRAWGKGRRAKGRGI